MEKCKICGKEVKSIGRHIKIHNIVAEHYYDMYIRKETEGYCKTCGNKAKFKSLLRGYSDYCSLGCANRSEEVKQKSKNTKKQKYGNENYNNREKYIETCLEKYGVVNTYSLEEIKNKSHSNEAREKYRNTCLSKYGVDSPFKTERVKQLSNSDKIKEKIKQTNLEKYGVENQFQRKEVIEKSMCKEVRDRVKITMLSKYGVDNIFKLDSVKEKVKSHESREKANRTREKNNFRSTYEIKLENFLKENNIVYETEWDKDSRYPFLCDFYLPKCDMFVEIHGSWHHGGHFFDINNEYDVKKLEIWKLKSKKDTNYSSAIKTWTEKDILKRDTAIKNNLNYIVLWSLEEIDDFCNLLLNQKYDII